jgi:hypothetical protein
MLGVTLLFSITSTVLYFPAAAEAEERVAGRDHRATARTQKQKETTRMSRRVTTNRFICFVPNASMRRTILQLTSNNLRTVAVSYSRIQQANLREFAKKEKIMSK